jgi:CSLREA domain-containing protein
MRTITPRHVEFAASILLLVCWAAPCSADDIYVTITADTNDGLCGGPVHFPCSLRDAVMLSNNMPGNDTIHVPPGEYRLTIPGMGEDSAVTGDLDILDNVTIQGSGAGVTIVDALANDRVFHIPYNVWAYFNDLTIRGGNSTNSPVSVNGAGIRNEGVAVNLTRCIVEDNVTTTGLGGGLDNSGGVAFVLDSIFRDNLARNGSAITSSYGTLTIERSTLEGNYQVTANPGGGTVWAREANVTIKNTTVCDNETQLAGPPGGLSFRDGHVIIHSCTLADNEGQEIFSESGHPAAVTLSNTIIKGTCSGVFPQSNGGNVGDDAGNYCGFQPGQDIWGVPILLHPLGDYGGPTPTMPPIYVLNDGNLAIDNGWADANCLPEDQHGNPRPLDGNGDGMSYCDSGAVEVTYAELPFTDGFEFGDVGQWTRKVPIY